MPAFRYTARDGNGRLVESLLDAPTRREALRQLAARGLQPVRLEEGRAAAPRNAGGLSLLTQAPASFSRREHLPFLQALYELTVSGLSAGEAVRLLSLRLKEKNLRALSTAVWEKLSEGQTLSKAMEQLPQTFDRHTVSLIRAAEATGNINEVLLRLIEHFTQQQDMRQKLVTALVYPVFVCFVAFGVILFFIFFLLPRLQGLLSSLGGKLPFVTQVLVDSAQFLTGRWGLVTLILVTGGVISFWRWRKTDLGRAATDRWFVRAPFLRDFVLESTLLNFSQILAVLLENGIPTAEALRLTERTVTNRTLQVSFHEATDRVLEGESLSLSLNKTGYFPDLLLDRIAVGESTGKLAPCLRDISRNFAIQHSRRLQTLTKVISSAVLIFAFAFVGLIAYAIVSAVLEVSNSFKM